MRAVVQRCNWCRVDSEGKEVSSIGKGLSVLLGVKKGDTEKDAGFLVDTNHNILILDDDAVILNISLLYIKGELSIVSQFTLYGDARHGRRPSFTEAEAPDRADELYRLVVEKCEREGLTVGTGVFRTYMKVALENDGPVTILLDSEKNF